MFDCSENTFFVNTGQLDELFSEGKLEDFALWDDTNELASLSPDTMNFNAILELSWDKDGRLARIYVTTLGPELDPEEPNEKPDEKWSGDTQVIITHKGTHYLIARRAALGDK